MLETLFNAIAFFFQSVWGFGAYAAIAFVLIFSLAKNRKLFVISLAATVALGFALKLFFAADRPCVDGVSLMSCQLLTGYGFPSNHALISTGIAMGAIGTFLFWPLLAMSIIISLSRVWLGAHSFTQIAGGMALAVMVFLAVFELNKRLYGDDYKFDLDEMLGENLLNKKVF